MSEITPFYQGDFEVKVQDETGKKYENGIALCSAHLAPLPPQSRATSASRPTWRWRWSSMWTPTSTTAWSRILCHSNHSSSANPLTPHSGIRFSAALVEKLYENEPNYYNPLVNIPSLADKFEYVTHGKIFKFVEADKKLYCFLFFSFSLLSCTNNASWV